MSYCLTAQYASMYFIQQKRKNNRPAGYCIFPHKIRIVLQITLRFILFGAEVMCDSAYENTIEAQFPGNCEWIIFFSLGSLKAAVIIGFDKELNIFKTSH